MKLTTTIPKLRTWHLLGIVATSAAFISVMQFRWTVEDDGYALIRRLRSTDAGERATAAYRLMALRPRERRAISPLTEMLFDNDPQARAAAADALLQIASGSPTDVIDEVQVTPVKAALASALGDRDPMARLAIAQALGNLGTEPKVIVPTLLEFALDRDPGVRRQAIRILGRYGRRSEPALVALFAALKDHEPLVRGWAVDSLVNSAVFPDFAPAPFVGRIVSSLLDESSDPDPQVRLEVVTALTRIGHRTRTEDPRLVRFLSDPDIRVKDAVFTYLAWNQPTKRAPEFLPGLERALSDPSSKSRQAAAYTLGRIGLIADVTLPSLRARVDDPVEVGRETFDEAIRAIEKEVRKFRSETLPQAIDELGDADPIHRALAAGRIEDFGPRASEAVPALVVCLADREAEVRRAAARALGQLGPRAAVAVAKLADLAESDPDEEVRLAAKLSRAILLRTDQGPDR